MYVRDGFPGQRLHVLPAPLVSKALRREPTARLLVTDAGYFPHAARHGRIRPTGAAQTIVIVCVGGSGRCEVEGRQHPARAGQVVVIPAGVPHRYFADTDDPWSIWWVHLVGSDVPALVRAAGLDARRPVATLTEVGPAADLVSTACDFLARDETRSSLIAAAGAGWHLLARLSADRERRSAGAAGPLRIVRDRLRQDLAAPLSVPELAAEAGLSVSYFSARFRSATGFGVLEYAKRQRMARARQLLISSDRTVAEIAAEVGYADPFYFSRQFHGVNGVSPSRFRHRYTSDQPEAEGRPG